MTFFKYHGTGNDFILFDNREGKLSFTTDQIAFMCHRRFGIGADGLMLLEQAAGYDFRMVYYNSDGRESTMCGNGGRCIVAFAKNLGIITGIANFLAIDGPHVAIVDWDGKICLHMNNVSDITASGDHTILNTGSPHYICYVADVENTDIFNKGRAIRNQERFQPDGINVNFVQKMADKLWVRTYERGVEDETLSCGTGVTAAAIADSKLETGSFSTKIETPGGTLEISFKKNTPLSATDVILKGPAVFVFMGDVTFSI